MMILCTVLAAPVLAAADPLRKSIDPIYADLDALYIDLHKTPELSRQEVQTSAKMADRLRRLGFDVTTQIGGHGVVGLLRNGDGPTVMLRADLDGLPIEEKTGVPYASQVIATSAAGKSVPVMHACGHDIHMTAWVGAATLLANARDRWRGTLMMVAQPAEETGSGALAMLKDGLFTRFPKPDFAFGIHDHSGLPAGKVAFTSGFALASVDSVDATIFGRGGHGAYPHTTVDPIVIAARSVVALQTLVARENNPLDPAVVTVGSIHGGSKHNIIPDEVRLQITVRSYKEAVRKKLLAGIDRILKAEAAAANAPREPTTVVSESTPATFNDPALTSRLAAMLRARMGTTAVVELPPVMGAEDFAEYGRAGVPAAIFWVGGVEPQKFAEAKRSGAVLPSLHSPHFVPAREPTIRTAVETMTAAALELLAKPAP
jgi:hippurate hydrolase